MSKEHLTYLMFCRVIKLFGKADQLLKKAGIQNEVLIVPIMWLIMTCVKYPHYNIALNIHSINFIF